MATWTKQNSVSATWVKQITNPGTSWDIEGKAHNIFKWWGYFNNTWGDSENLASFIPSPVNMYWGYAYDATPSFENYTIWTKQS